MKRVSDDIMTLEYYWLIVYVYIRVTSIKEDGIILIQIGTQYHHPNFQAQYFLLT